MITSTEPMVLLVQSQYRYIAIYYVYIQEPVEFNLYMGHISVNTVRV